SPTGTARRSRLSALLALASLALPVFSLGPADAAPARNHSQHYQYGAHAKAARAHAAVPASAWAASPATGITSKGKTIEVFGHMIALPWGGGPRHPRPSVPVRRRPGRRRCDDRRYRSRAEPRARARRLARKPTHGGRTVTANTARWLVRRHCG